MKKLLLFLVSFPLMILAQDPNQTHLVGLLKVEDRQVAVVESRAFRTPEHQIVLREGQREGSLEVLRINAENGTTQVKLAAESEPRVLRLAVGGMTNGTPDGLVFDGVGLRTMMKFLGDFSERTVLQHPSLPPVKFSLQATATNRAEAARILREAVEAKDIVVVPDGRKFLLVAAKTEAAKLNPQSAQLAPASGSSESEVIPRGSILFAPATVPNVLTILAEFRGARLDRTTPLPDGMIYLTMETALTKAECRYAMETLIGWLGIKLVPSGDGSLKAVSTSSSAK